MTRHTPQAELRPAAAPWLAQTYGEAGARRIQSVAPIGPHVRYGLIEQVGCRSPVRAFARACDLAAAIHRRRRGQALQLQDQRLVCGACEADVVAVYTQDESGYRSGFLAYAYLGGAGWRALQAELYALQPNPAARAEAMA